MPDLYPYLIASLPMLHFGAPAHISFEQFLLKCQELIPQDDFTLLESLPLQCEYKGAQATIRRWVDFEIMLRNELVKLRASRKRIDPAKYLRPDGSAGAILYHVALAAQRNPSPLEGERILALAKWDFLEELSFGHYFDLDFLIIYACKLLILEHWERIKSADKNKILTEALAGN
ncbi:MAG: DUF2764 family protein [Candidatus Omnitrophica bacterium]|nr:DUF2764 family protein [Candidatus Omnitrophota bacterium]MDD5592510.1 DUF2764 family protein [Candidatus Omnitrophota bacterium]